MNAVVESQAPQEPAQAIAAPGATSILQVIERAARDPSVDLEKMERLMLMHERLSARQAEAQYAEALARLQPKLPIIKERGSILNKEGRMQSKYAYWEDIVGVIAPILAEEGFSLSFRIAHPENTIEVTGVLQHRAGHKETTAIRLPSDTSGNKNPVQAVASSVSYGKRYTGGALLNLRTGELDNDGAGGGVELITEKQAIELKAMLEAIGPKAYGNFLKAAKVQALADIPAKNYQTCLNLIKARQKP